MMRVLKFVLSPGVTRVEAAAFGRPLTVGWQGRDLVVWIEAEPGKGQARDFAAIPTGDAVPIDGYYVGSAQTDAFGARLVFHVYGKAFDELAGA